MSVPKLRFREFDGSWTENRIGEITLKVGSGSTPLGGEKVDLSTEIRTHD
jgi:type I restriction enzyme, S subunit